MAQTDDNRVNNNVHPNSRAARGDEAVDAERRAREEAAPASEVTDPDTGAARVQELENEVAELKDQISDLETAAEGHDIELAEANKTVEAAQADVEAANKERDAAVERAEKAEAKVKELQDAAKGNKAYVPDEDGAGVRGQTGDADLDAHTESNDSVVPPEGVRGKQDGSDGNDSDDSDK